jgi:hypothetical protein
MVNIKLIYDKEADTLCFLLNDEIRQVMFGLESTEFLIYFDVDSVDGMKSLSGEAILAGYRAFHLDCLELDGDEYTKEAYEKIKNHEVKGELIAEKECVYWYDNYKFADAFWTPYSDYKDRIGQKFEVIRRATTDDNIDEECLPQWLIKFEDGAEIFSCPEEIIEEEVEDNRKRIGGK